MKFTLYDASNGRVLQGGTADDPYCFAQDGQAVLDGFSHFSGWITGGLHCTQPAQPSRHHTFDWTTKTWQDLRTLQDLQDEQWEAIKQAREAALAAPLITPYGVFDADPVASANIIKSVLLANNLTALGYPVAIDFTLYDNSVVVLDAPAMVQVGLLLAAREQEIRAHATALRAQIESATTVQAVAAVAWQPL
jgi:hypothetical protein